MRNTMAAMPDTGSSALSELEKKVKGLARRLTAAGKAADQTTKSLTEAAKATKAVATLLRFDEINRLKEKTSSAAKATKVKTGQTEQTNLKFESIEGLKGFHYDFWPKFGFPLDENDGNTSGSRFWQGFKQAIEDGLAALNDLLLGIGIKLLTSPLQLWEEFKLGWGSPGVGIGNTLLNTAATLWQGFAAGWGTRSVSVINTLLSTAGGLWKSFAANWGTRSVSVVNTLTNSATELWNRFKEGWSGKKLSLKLSLSTAVGAVQTAVYKALGLAGWPTISFAARGGVFSGPTLTMLGEAGTEAVVPLENNTGWMDVMAAKLDERMGGQGTITIPIYIGGEKVAEQVVRAINDATRRTGVCPLYI